MAEVTDASISLSESVRSDDHMKFADFIVSCKQGDSEGAVEFLRQVVLAIDPSGLKPALPRKKQRTDTPVKAVPTPAPIITETPPDLSYHVGDEVDSKAATTLLLIPNKTTVIAAVIGKSGSQISHIQKTSGAKVQVDKTENKSIEYVEVTITGTVSTNDVAQAMIMQKVVSAAQAKDMPAETTAYNNILVVPNQAVRYLIGKGGGTIKELQSASGAHIQFEAEKGMKPGAAGRQVTIQASSELSRNRCTYLIHRKIAEDAKVDVNWVPKKESRVMASGLPSSTEQGQSGALDYNPFHGILPPQQNMLQNYLPQQQMNALSNPYAALPGAAVGNMGMGGVNGMGGLPGMGGAAGMGGLGTSEPQTTVDLLVPNAAVSRLIGKQGKNIVELQNTTGAKIQFQKEAEMAPGATERKVSLSGTQMQTSAAQQMISSQLMVIQQAHLAS